MDGQGRILVPPGLRRLAGLDRDVVVIGAMDRFEIWPAERWAAFATEAESLLDSASSELAFGANAPSTSQD